MTDMDPAHAVAAIKAILGITPTDAPVAARQPYIVDYTDPDDWCALISEARAFTAEQKVELIEAMGFRPGGSDHQWDCGYQFDSGIRCNCIPPATTWSQPRDVDVYRGETMEQRMNDKRDRRIPACER